MKVGKIVEVKKKSTGNLKKYILLYVSFLIYSGTTICAKMAALHKIFSIPFLFYVALEFVLLGIYAVLWQQVLKQFSLVSAMANKGIVVIFGLLWSMFLFQETVSIYNIVGAIVILIGMWVVSIDG